MQVADFDQLWEQTFIDSSHGKIYLLDAPTGSGKSHSVTDFICQRAQKDSNFKAFFVTDQKINLGVEAFFDCWENFKSPKVAPGYKKIAIIRSLKDTVDLLLSEKNEEKIPVELMRDQKFKAAIDFLQKQVDIYNYSLGKGGDFDSWKALLEPELKLRQVLACQLNEMAGGSADFPTDKNAQQAIKKYLSQNNNSVSQWLSRVYPTINLESYQIYILTVDKFIRSYTPFFNASGEAFIFSDLIKDRLVIFDEFDRVKRRLWDKSLEDSLRFRVDLVSLFSSLANALNKVDAQMPKDLKQILISNEERSNLLKLTEDLQTTYKLDHLYKIKGQSAPRNFLIRTPLDTIVSGNEHWKIDFNQRTNFVDITHTGRDQLHFQQMLVRLASFIKRFNRYIFICGQRYMDQRNGKLPVIADAINLVNSVRTIYSALGLAPNQIEALLNLETQIDRKRFTKNNHSKTVPDGYHEFQRLGLSLYFFNDSEQHDLQTVINAAFFSITPERYLLKLVGKCQVWGISATANFPTVLDNFDLTYLKERLENNLRDARPLLTPSTQAEFDFKERYDRHGIQVEAEIVGISDNITGTLKALLEISTNHQIDNLKNKIDWKAIGELDDLLEAKLKELTGTDLRNRVKHQTYIKNRYLALFESFMYFMLDSTRVTFLGLQSKLPDFGPEMNIDLIKHVFLTLKEQVAIDGDKVNIQLYVIPDKDKNNNSDTPKKNTAKATAQNLKQALDLSSGEPQRVYLLSAYLSIGVGQNLQHKLCQLDMGNDRSSIAEVSADPNDYRHLTKDLEGIYMGDVTHIMTRLEDFDLDETTLRYVTELEYLLDADEIGYREIKAAFLALQQHRPYLRSFKYVPSVQASYTRMIVQALGRMNRTFNKVKQPLVLASSNVIASIDTLGLELSRFSPEFQALYELTESEKGKSSMPLFNIWEKDTAICTRDINSLVVRLRQNPESAARYDHVRNFLLSHPTIAKKDLVEVQQATRECMQYLPNPKRQTDYQVKVLSSKLGDFDFNALDGKGLAVSATSSGLPIILEYPGMQAHFLRNGYACKWEPDEYILNPAQFINLYTGILGEVAGKFILEDIFAVKLQKFENFENNELFDYQITDNIAIDFKNWRSSHSENAADARKHVQKKLKQLEKNTGETWRVIIINIIGESEQRVTTTIDGHIMEVPGLIDEKGKLILNRLKTIGGFINEN